MSKIDDTIEKALREFHDEAVSSVYPYVYSYAMTLVTEAVAQRLEAPEAHNFTGNLLNSIVACVYKDGKPDVAYFSNGKVRGAIRAKMTYPNHYHFKVDYDGAVDSDYTPDVETDQGYGAEDAQAFFSEYVPSSNEKYTIVLAYTTEYADWVEQMRHTTGFARTYQFARKTAKGYLCNLPRTDGNAARFSAIEVPF